MSNLKKILIKAKKSVFSEMVGNNPSIFKGEGYDFIELREYMSGDDIRHIDWNITAKMQTPYIKIFREERELNVSVVVMLNGSVHFGSKRLKQELIAEIVAILGFSVVRNGDLLTNFIFADRLYEVSKPSKKLFSVHKSVENVLNFEAIGKMADYDQMVETLFKRLKRRSLVIVIADFFDSASLKLLAKKHEVLAVIVRDRFEENPPEFGFSTLVDPENSATLEGDFNSHTSKTYSAKVHDHDSRLYKNLRSDGVRFTKIYTDENPSIALRRLFEKSK